MEISVTSLTRTLDTTNPDCYGVSRHSNATSLHAYFDLHQYTRNNSWRSSIGRAAVL